MAREELSSNTRGCSGEQFPLLVSQEKFNRNVICLLKFEQLVKAYQKLGPVSNKLQ